MFEAHELPADEADDDALFDAYVDAGATFLLFCGEGPDWGLDGLCRLLAWRERRG